MMMSRLSPKVEVAQPETPVTPGVSSTSPDEVPKIHLAWTQGPCMLDHGALTNKTKT